MQTNGQLRPNITRVIDCIEWLLKQIKPANNGSITYYTDGVVVDRNRDPRKLKQDKAEDFRQLGSLVRIAWGDGKNIPGELGASIREATILNLICRQALSSEQDEKGITVDHIQAWLEHDIKWSLMNDPSGLSAVSRAAMALNATAGPWGPIGTFGGIPSCINLTFVERVAGPVAAFPDCWMILRYRFEYDETGPDGRAHIV